MYALITGYLFRDPELKTSKSGASYAKATVKEGRVDETIFASIVAFRNVADELMSAKDGDAINVMGELKLRCYEKDGTWRPSADVVANKVTLLAKPAKRQSEQSASPLQRRAADIIDDNIPF
jgi:single-stranded DNA-binding protein